jgi:hypothetical protein
VQEHGPVIAIRAIFVVEAALENWKAMQKAGR